MWRTLPSIDWAGCKFPPLRSVPRVYEGSGASTTDCSRATLGVAQAIAHRRDAAPRRAPHSAFLCDGEGQNRTGDTTIFSRVLYQLSYLAGWQRLASGMASVDVGPVEAVIGGLGP